MDEPLTYPARLRAAFEHDPTVMIVIIINALALFLDAFPAIHAAAGHLLHWVDYACLVFFVLEALAKTRGFQEFNEYWAQSWNKVDFIVVVFSLPVLVSPLLPPGFDDLTLLLLLRLGRLLRFVRGIRYVPRAEKVLKGVGRALKASVSVFLVLMFVNVIFGLGATLLFQDIPEAQNHFGNPFRSIYSMFKVFTIEGWYEIPDQMERLGVSGRALVGMRAYFTVAVLVGGLIGLSIANAVFVDEMIADNTEDVEEAVDKLYKAFEQFVDRYDQDQASSAGGSPDP